MTRRLECAHIQPNCIIWTAGPKITIVMVVVVVWDRRSIGVLRIGVANVWDRWDIYRRENSKLCSCLLCTFIYIYACFYPPPIPPIPRLFHAYRTPIPPRRSNNCVLEHLNIKERTERERDHRSPIPDTLIPRLLYAYSTPIAPPLVIVSY